MDALLTFLLGEPLGIIVYQIAAAARFTIYLSLIAFIGGGMIAAVITIMRIAPVAAFQYAGSVYIWTFQSVPLLMLLFLSGLGVPRLFGVDIDPWTAATISLVLFTSAYLADTWRGAIAAIDQGQWEAGYALNLNFIKILRLIIWPQVYKYALAPTVGFMIQIIKGTSLAYIIGFQDLMLLGKRWANSPVLGSEPYIIFPLIALFYFALCYPLALLARRLEKKYQMR